MKRTLSGIFCSLVLVSSVFASGTSFPDTAGYRFASQIETLRSHGIVDGYADGSFRPDAPINRAEFLKILLLAVLGNEGSTSGDHHCFTDFRAAEKWYWATACTAKDLDIVSGYPDGTFGGDRTVNLVEALKMTELAWKLPQPVFFRAPDHWYDPFLIVASSSGVFNVLPNEPSHLLTRGEMAAMLFAFHQPIQDVHGASSSESSVSSESSASSASSLNNPFPLPLMHGTLLIEQISSGTNTTAVGSSNVPLLTFDATAGRQNVLFTGLVLAPQTGSLTAANRYRLFVDTNGDGKPDTSIGDGVVRGTTLVFSGFRYPLAIGGTVRMEVRGDFSPGTSPTSLALGFATSDPQFIKGIGAVDGRDLSPGIQVDNGACGPSICWTTVHTRAARSVTVQGLGNLYVTQDATTVPSRQALLGTRSDPLLRLDFHATGEDVLVTGIAIGGGTNSISSLELSVDGSSTPFATARNIGCDLLTTGLFCAKAGAGFLTVPKDQDVHVVVRAVLKSDAEGGITSETFTPVLTNVTSPASSIAVTARGAQSNQAMIQTNGDAFENGEVFIGRSTPGPNIAITGPTHDLVAARFASIENINPDPDTVAVPSGISAFGQFRFKALDNPNVYNGTNAITIKTLTFTVSAQNVTVDVSSFRLFNLQNSGQMVSCNADTNTGLITVTCSDLSGINAVIGAGSFIDLGLEGNVTIGSGGGSRLLQASLGQLGNRSVPGTITWTDGGVTFDWVDLPVTQVKSTLYR